MFFVCLQSIRASASLAQAACAPLGAGGKRRLYSSKATYLQSQRLCAETHSSARHPLPVNCVKDELPIAEGPSPARLGEKPQGSPSKAATSSACDCKHRGGF